MTMLDANPSVRSPRTRRLDGNAWALSFSDLLSLLLGFFIVIVASSGLDAIKAARISKTMTAAMGVKDTSTPARGAQQPQAEVYRALTAYIEAAGLESQLSLHRTTRGVELTTASDLLFASGSAEMQPRAEAILADIATILRDIPGRIIVEGHTDSRRMRSALYPSNWELSAARASRVVRSLAAKGVPAERMAAVGLAATRPVATLGGANGANGANGARDAHRQNRRVIVLLADDHAS